MSDRNYSNPSHRDEHEWQQRGRDDARQSGHENRNGQQGRERWDWQNAQSGRDWRSGRSADWQDNSDDWGARREHQHRRDLGLTSDSSDVGYGAQGGDDPPLQGSDSRRTGYGAQRGAGAQPGYGSQGGYGSQRGGSHGYGSYGYGGYAAPGAGVSGYEGGGMSAQAGQSHLGHDWNSPARNQGHGHEADYGGFGNQSGGYGSQSSYAAHGGYGSQGQGHYSQGSPGSQGSYGQPAGWAPAGAGNWQRGFDHTDQQGSWQRRAPKGYKRSDERIKEDLSEHLMRSAHLDASDVAIDVKEGKVTLEGTVPDRRMKHAIEDIAAACPGAIDVDNRIRVVPGAHPEHGREAWGSGGSAGPTSTGTGSTTHGASSTVGGTGSSSSTSPAGSARESSSVKQR